MPDSNAKVTGDFSDLIGGAANAAKALESLGAKAANLTNPFSMATKTVDGMITTLGRIGLAAQGLEAIGKSAAAMGMGLLKGNANLEMVTISFKTLLGSASAANDMIKQLTTFAANTPFNLPGLELATQRLLGAGYAAKDIVPMMTALGDSIAALGGTQDQLNSLVYVFGQMRNEAHLNAGDIMQMSNLGIPALQMLADHYHVTTAQIQEMISKGLIPGKEAAAIFATEMEKKYGGMMDAQSKTFSGMISNLQDWATATTIILTKPFFEPAKKALQAFLDYVQSPAGVAIINKMAAEIQLGVDKATAAFVRFEPQIKPTLERLLKVAEAVRGQMTPGIITLIPLLEKLWTRVEPLALSFWKLEQAVKPASIALAALKGFIQGGLPGAIDALKDRFALIGGYVKKAFDFALVEAKKFGPGLLTWVADTAIMLANKIVTWGEALIVWVAPYAVKLVNALIHLAERVISWAIDYAPVVANQLLRWGEAIVDWVLPQIPRVLNVLGQFGTQVLKWLEKEAPILARDLLYWTEILAGWIIPAIPGVIRALEVVGAAIVNWGVTRLPVLIGEVIVGIGKGFGVNLQRPVNDVLKVFNALVASIKNTVFPAFFQMTRFLSTDLMPVVDRLANFISRTVIPTFASLAAFMMTTVVPIFVRAADLFGLVFGPSLTLIGSIIRNELLPSLSDSWKYFDGKYMPTVRDLASALGEKLAGGIREATDKFEAAIPKLEGFYKKLEPIIGKAIDLYKAISPISIALDILKGFLTGGLQGGLGALEQHVVDLGKVFGLDLQPVIDWFNDTVVKKVIPTLQEWARVFIEDWWPHIRDAVVFVWQKLGDFWDFVSTKLWPPFKSFLDWLGEQWGKVGKSIGDTWENTIKPALVQFWDYITNVLWPKLRDDVFPWIEKNVKPKLETAFSIIADTIIPNLGKLIDIILNHVIPTLVAWWGVLFALINPFIKTLGDLTDTLAKNLGLTHDGAKNNLDSFGKLADKFKNDVVPVLTTIANGFHTLWEAMGGWLFESVFKNIANLIGLVGLLGDIFDKLSHNDIMGAAQDAIKAQALFNTYLGKDKQVINGGQDPSAANGWPSPGQYGYRDPSIPSAPHANGTMSAGRGLALVGERGMELIRDAQNQLLLATRPMFLNFKGGERVYNNSETLAMFRSMPANPQQIHNMYQNSNSYGNNAYSNVNNYNLGVHTNQSPQVVQSSFGMMKVMYGRS